MTQATVFAPTTVKLLDARRPVDPHHVPPSKPPRNRDPSCSLPPCSFASCCCRCGSVKLRMQLPDTELQQQLMEAGNRLMNTSPSVEQLLPLLDEVENCLSRVKQSQSQSMQNALSHSLEELVTDPIFRHPDVDVKVAVASCISEITRITAPDAPYDDEHMKEVFQLIVSSFKNLFEMSSRSYAKWTSILETVAKVRSCVLMLDLECDALIIEMFQNFFKTVRSPMAAWSDLPVDILFSISKCIPNDRDLLCFRSICVSWRSSCPPQTPPPLPSCKLSVVHKETDAYGFSAYRRSLFLVKGTNHSWLIKSESSYKGRMILYCPLSAERRHFRDNVLDVSKFREVLKLGHEDLCVTHGSFGHDLGRLALIPTGTDHRFIFLAQSYAGGLAFFRSGDTHCTLLQNSYGSVDIASFNDRFYAVYQWGRTCVVDQSGNTSWFMDLVPPNLSSDHVLRYLVESENRLLLVDVGFNRPVERQLFQFRMYKLNVEMSRWDKVKLELGDQVLFLGEVGSFSLSAAQLGWLRGNYIFFRFRDLHESVERLYGYRNLYGDEKSIYVYDLEKGKSRSLAKCYPDQLMNLFSPAPEWFLQSDETLPFEFPFKRSLMRICNILENWGAYFPVVIYGCAALFCGFAGLQ